MVERLPRRRAHAALYQDPGGVPGAKVAESSAVNADLDSLRLIGSLSRHSAVAC